MAVRATDLRPKPRTEYEVAAATVIALIDAGFIKKDAATLARVSGCGNPVI